MAGYLQGVCATDKRSPAPGGVALPTEAWERSAGPSRVPSAARFHPKVRQRPLPRPAKGQRFEPGRFTSERTRPRRRPLQGGAISKPIAAYQSATARISASDRSCAIGPITALSRRPDRNAFSCVSM